MNILCVDKKQNISITIKHFDKDNSDLLENENLNITEHNITKYKQDYTDVTCVVYNCIPNVTRVKLFDNLLSKKNINVITKIYAIVKKENLKFALSKWIYLYSGNDLVIKNCIISCIVNEYFNNRIFYDDGEDCYKILLFDFCKTETSNNCQDGLFLKNIKNMSLMIENGFTKKYIDKIEIEGYYSSFIPNKHICTLHETIYREIFTIDLYGKKASKFINITDSRYPNDIMINYILLYFPNKDSGLKKFEISYTNEKIAKTITFDRKDFYNIILDELENPIYIIPLSSRFLQKNIGEDVFGMHDVFYIKKLHYINIEAEFLFNKCDIFFGSHTIIKCDNTYQRCEFELYLQI
jgi:hypothetical protein